METKVRDVVETKQRKALKARSSARCSSHAMNSYPQESLSQFYLWTNSSGKSSAANWQLIQNFSALG
jgi:hypothetical protein